MADDTAMGETGRFALSAEALRRSVLSAGDTTRLRAVLARAARGEPVTLGVIGGSITQGAAATRPAHRYADRLAARLARRFPQSAVTLVNAGRGATGSNYGALRAPRDLLPQRPDLVVLEWAVNDGIEPSFGASLEGLVRQVLRQPHAPAALLLFMMRQDGTNAQARLATVGAHYGLPMISYRDALWPEIEAGRLTWADISPDEVHPNDLGHALAAELVDRFVADAADEVARSPGSGPIAGQSPVPPPLYSDGFEFTMLLEAPAARPVASAGWAMDAHADPWPCWRADRPGSTITFELSGRTLLLMYYRIRGDAGTAAVRVNDGPPRELDAWFPGTWGGYRETVTIADGLGTGPHRVEIRLLDRRNQQATGNEFRILGLGGAGAGH